MSKIVPLTYEDRPVQFNTDGWINATEVAKRFGKEPYEWLRLPETIEYMDALAEQLGLSDPGLSRNGLVKTKRGGKAQGSWFHPKLAVPFARWLDVRFAIWCDMQIDSLIRGDWQKARREASIGYRWMSETLQLSREGEGKATNRHHYANEARLINSVIHGTFKGRDRNQLNDRELEAVVFMEGHNARLIAQGKPYDERKDALIRYAQKRLEGKP